MMPRVGLRARLAGFFVAITVLPLFVAVVALQVQITDQLDTRAQRELASVSSAATVLIQAQRARAGDLADDLVARGVAPILAAADERGARTWLTEQAGRFLPSRAGIVALVGPAGQPLALLTTEPDFVGDPRLPTSGDFAAAALSETAPTGTLLEIRGVQVKQPDGSATLLGYVVTGAWLDGQLLERLGLAGEGRAFVTEDRALAVRGEALSALDLAALPPAGSAAPGKVNGRDVLITTAPVASTTSLILWTPRTTTQGLRSPLVLLALGVLASGILGWLLAGGVVAPVRRAAEVARAVAGGDLRQSLEPRGGRELAELATSLNTMTSELQMRQTEQRRSLARLGQTLSSSLDLNRTLAVVVETAMATLSASGGVLMLLTSEGDALYTKVARGLPTVPGRLALGAGVIGTVAQQGKPVRLPVDAAKVPSRAPGEPADAHQLSIPMLGRGRVIGVLTLLRDVATRPFTQEDLDTIGTYAAQASVAIENVMLHREAQRLSVTDPLSGLWNFRYFQLQADRELAAAARAHRPLSLLVCDIDFFKSVNDQYGHQVGDEVLVEVARRIRDQTRVPDVVARYGGEEFVVLLHDTDLDGAVATAERIRAAIADTPVVGHPGGVEGGRPQSMTITASIGVAAIPGHGDSVASLLRTADTAMYLAKRKGRNQVVRAARAAAARGRRAS